MKIKKPETKPEFKIGPFTIGTGRTFIIAEIGNNHNGNLDRALLMVDRAIEMGADCAKFQMRRLDQVYRKKTIEKNGEDLGTEYIIDLLKKFELSLDEHKKVAQYCHTKGILYLCTPWDSFSVDFLEEIGVLAYKVASADLTNLPLIDRLISTGKPLILSTGMSTEEEIKHVVSKLTNKGSDFVLLHCNSTYPAPFHDINIRLIEKLKTIHSLVGYSGHERGIAVSHAAVALGACVIERHFSLDRNMEGPDHAASLEFEDFSRLVEGIREIEAALGTGMSRQMSQGEMINRENLGKSLVAAKDIKSGTIITQNHFKVRSPGQGLSPIFAEKLIGIKISRDMLEEDFFFQSDLSGRLVQPKTYHFSRPWGIPVRYHDFAEYKNRIKPDLFEFHLSYSDMDLVISDYLDTIMQCDFVVHAPELFSGSRLMDLATPDKAYRQESIYETQRVINITRELNKYFPKSQRPCIVANIGGFSMDAPLPSDLSSERYHIFAESLGQLDLNGVELIPQTMAPFPWHFGGQRFQNLFVKPDEITTWCRKLNLRICFDISHSRLTCNHFGMDFYDFCQTVAPITAHLHLGDAKGLNGEGLQIGEGDLDFKRIGRILAEGCPEASFIPEIWQGHKNFGEGFWIALDRLNGIL